METLKNKQTSHAVCHFTVITQLLAIHQYTTYTEKQGAVCSAGYNPSPMRLKQDDQN